MTKRIKRTKPPWDKSIPGTHPAFKKPTKAEIKAALAQQEEARSLAESMGAKQMSPRQRWLSQARSREKLHRLNFNYFLEVSPKVVGGASVKAMQIHAHRYGLVCALRDLGRFSDALNLALTSNGRARPGFRQLVQEILAWSAAIDSDDSYDCGCKRRTHTVDDPNSLSGKTVEIEIPRRAVIGWVYSHKHRGIADIWRCSVCGHLNAHKLGPPPAQRRMLRLRAMAARGTLKPGPEHMDHILLKRTI